MVPLLRTRKLILLDDFLAVSLKVNDGALIDLVSSLLTRNALKKIRIDLLVMLILELAIHFVVFWVILEDLQKFTLLDDSQFYE